MKLPQDDSRSPAPGSELSMSEGVVGHQMYCPKCRETRSQTFRLIGNGMPVLVRRCRECGHEERFKFAVSGWMPESLIETMDDFVESKIAAARNPKIESHDHDDLFKTLAKPGRLDTIMSWRRKAHGDEAPMTELVDRALDDQRRKSLPTGVEVDHFRAPTRLQRFKAWITCKRYLLFVALPASVPLLLMGACGVLFYKGVYVHPIYEWIAPLWRPWMYSVWLMVVPIVASVGLFAGYVRCRLDNREQDAGDRRAMMDKIDETLYGEEHRSEHDIMGEIDQL